jgi:predicted PolB exonuclease-like 3'-5' exonuclease
VHCRARSLLASLFSRLQREGMKMFQQGSGDWTQYRSRFNLSKSDEIDLHFGKRDRSVSYDEAMAELTGIIEGGLKEAQRKGRSYVMFIHGSSTSQPGKRTARSQVRSFMRSKAATSLIERKHCIQHDTVFVAKVRTSDEAAAS